MKNYVNKKGNISYTDVFSVHSRYIPELLYGREEDLRNLLSIKEELTLLKGTRRVGKTSTLLTLLKIISTKDYKEKFNVKDNWVPIYISLDIIKGLNDLAINLLPLPKLGIVKKKFNYKTWRDLKNGKYPSYLVKFLNNIVENLVNIKNLGLGVEGFSFSSGMGIEKNIEPKTVLKILEDSAVESKAKIALVIDEAQRAYKWASDFLQFLKTIVDEFHDTFKVYITGSLVRPIELLLSREYESELHGRQIATYTLREIPITEAIKMLKDGFNLGNVKYDEWVISSAINLTYRIPGWLSLFGKYYVESDVQDLKERTLYSIKRSYEDIGKVIREEINTMKRIRKDHYYENSIQIILKRRDINPYELSKELKCDIKEAEIILNKLQEMDFIRLEGNRYKLNDPTLITLYNNFMINEEICPLCGKGKALVGNIRFEVMFSCGHIFLT